LVVVTVPTGNTAERPDSVTVCGVSAGTLPRPKLSVDVCGFVPDAAVGAKLTVSTQLAPGARTAPQAFAGTNAKAESPVSVGFSDRAKFPVFVTVTTGLVRTDPTRLPPKLKLEGLSVAVVSCVDCVVCCVRDVGGADDAPPHPKIGTTAKRPRTIAKRFMEHLHAKCGTLLAKPMQPRGDSFNR